MVVSKLDTLFLLTLYYSDLGAWPFYFMGLHKCLNVNCFPFLHFSDLVKYFFCTRNYNVLDSGNILPPLSQLTTTHIPLNSFYILTNTETEWNQQIFLLNLSKWVKSEILHSNDAVVNYGTIPLSASHLTRLHLSLQCANRCIYSTGCCSKCPLVTSLFISNPYVYIKFLPFLHISLKGSQYTGSSYFLFSW